MLIAFVVSQRTVDVDIESFSIGLDIFLDI
jgi:hypothetical protein